MMNSFILDEVIGVFCKELKYSRKGLGFGGIIDAVDTAGRV